ncbi:MAG TPA: hypothetical protein VG710_08185 [Opitutus sp.]|nr:hypothetical protein [Opitutus sp.]
MLDQDIGTPSQACGACCPFVPALDPGCSVPSKGARSRPYAMNRSLPAVFIFLLSIVTPGTAADSARSPEYAAIQARLARGWNTCSALKTSGLDC